MSQATICHNSRHVSMPCISRVPVSRPFVWLRLGLTDFRQHWFAALAYGTAFAVAGYMLVHLGWTRPHLGLVLTSGFMLVAPFLAVCFYDLAMRAESLERSGDAGKPYSSLRANFSSIALFGLMLAFMLSAWERISAIIIGAYLGTRGVPEAGFGWLLSMDNPTLLLAYLGFGAIFALLAFALSAVSLPMLMDRQVDIVTAVVTSLWTVWENRYAMVVWAALIVALMAMGVVSNFVLLAITFPLVGFATWHAYRDLVGT